MRLLHLKRLDGARRAEGIEGGLVPCGNASVGKGKNKKTRTHVVQCAGGGKGGDRCGQRSVARNDKGRAGKCRWPSRGDKTAARIGRV